MKCFIPFLFLVSAPLWVFAQNPPYDVFPNVEPPYYTVRYEASAEPGTLQFAVRYTVWIPPGVERLRGVVVHQHGCGEGSCKSGLTGAWDLHWQALAKKHDCALLSPSYEQPQKADCQMWCDPRNGSGAAFQQSLVDLGTQSGHDELATVPWALWGHSGGGHWCGGMVMLHPDRVAAAWLRSGVPLFEANPDRPLIKPHALPDVARAVPIMCNLGTKEGVTVKTGRFANVWPANETFLKTLRAKDGLVGVAVDPLTAHECGNSRYLAIPWLDICLTERLPEKTGGPLGSFDKGKAYVAPFLGKKAVKMEDFEGDLATASWFPNEEAARLWRYFIKQSEVPDYTRPPNPTDLQMKGNVLTWNTEADLESGLAGFRLYRSDTSSFPPPTRTMISPKGSNRHGRPLFQGLQYSDTPDMPLVQMRFVDTSAIPGKEYVYYLSAVNTVEEESGQLTLTVTIPLDGKRPL